MVMNILKPKDSERVNIAFLKARLAHFLRRVKEGNEITVLDRKLPVAKIIPFEEGAPLESAKPIGKFSDFVRSIKVPALNSAPVDSLKLLLEERGRR